MTVGGQTEARAQLSSSIIDYHEPFDQGFSLGYPKDTKFYLDSKASFIDISSIVSFKLFLVAWLREYCTFSDRCQTQRSCDMQTTQYEVPFIIKSEATKRSRDLKENGK